MPHCSLVSSTAQNRPFPAFFRLLGQEFPAVLCVRSPAHDGSTKFSRGNEFPVWTADVSSTHNQSELRSKSLHYRSEIVEESGRPQSQSDSRTYSTVLHTRGQNSVHSTAKTSPISLMITREKNQRLEAVASVPFAVFISDMSLLQTIPDNTADFFCPSGAQDSGSLPKFRDRVDRLDRLDCRAA